MDRLSFKSAGEKVLILSVFASLILSPAILGVTARCARTPNPPTHIASCGGGGGGDETAWEVRIFGCVCMSACCCSRASPVTPGLLVTSATQIGYTLHCQVQPTPALSLPAVPLLLHLTFPAPGLSQPAFPLLTVQLQALQRERENSNSKTLFSKDCICRERERERERERGERERERERVYETFKTLCNLVSFVNRNNYLDQSAGIFSMFNW